MTRNPPTKVPPLPSSPNEGLSQEVSDTNDGPASSPKEETGWSGWWFVGLLMAVNLLTAFSGVPLNTLVHDFGVPLFVLGVLAVPAFRWFRRPNRRDRTLHWARSAVEARGGGFYGAMAVLTFMALEGLDLWELWRQSEGLMDLLGSLGFEVLFGFAWQSILNGIWAGLWPLQWWNQLGLHALWLGILGGLGYQILAKVMGGSRGLGRSEGFIDGVDGADRP